MKILDTNVLIYAANRDLEFHKQVAAWLETALNGSESIGIPWIVLSGFVRIAINSRAFEKPLTVDRAFDLVDAWLAEPLVEPVFESGNHAARFREMLASSGGRSRLATDAHISAIARDHRATIVSCDDDFGRFPGLKTENPLHS